MLDSREQFGRHVGGRSQDGRVAMRDESVRQIANLGVLVEVQALHLLLPPDGRPSSLAAASRLHPLSVFWFTTLQGSYAGALWTCCRGIAATQSKSRMFWQGYAAVIA